MATSTTDSSKVSGFFSDNPDGVVSVTARGDNTGSTEGFEIGTLESTAKAARLRRDSADGGGDVGVFDWDEQKVLLFLPSGTTSFDFHIQDPDVLSADDTLSRFSFDISELPELGANWTQFTMVSSVKPDKYPILEGAQLTFQIRITEGFMVDQDEFESMFEDTENRRYREHILDLASGDHAVAQVWTHAIDPDVESTNSSSTEPRKAALWILGRNDGFHHAHVAKDLFFDKGIDLFVLNWRFNGLNAKYGFIDDPYYASHMPCGEINLYNEEVGLMVELIQSYGPYDSVLGYAHSTGAPILMSYLIDNGDADFDAFVLNSPFLDWDEGTWEVLLDNYPGFQANSVLGTDPAEGGPPIYEDNPVQYLGKTIVPSSFWAPSLFTLYYMEWTTRPQYNVPVTVGFVRTSNDAFDKINNHKGDISKKPLLVLSSRGDEILSSSEIDTLSRNIQADRQFILYQYNNHDVFLSNHMEDNQAAIDDVRFFLETNF